MPSGQNDGRCGMIKARGREAPGHSFMERSEKSWRSPIHGEANSFNDLHLTVHELPCGHDLNLTVPELTAGAVVNDGRGYSSPSGEDLAAG